MLATNCATCRQFGDKPNFNSGAGTCNARCASNQYWDGTTCSSCPAALAGVQNDRQIELIRNCAVTLAAADIISFLDVVESYLPYSYSSQTNHFKSFLDGWCVNSPVSYTDGTSTTGNLRFIVRDDYTIMNDSNIITSEGDSSTATVQVEFSASINQSGGRLCLFTSKIGTKDQHKTLEFNGVTFPAAVISHYISGAASTQTTNGELFIRYLTPVTIDFSLAMYSLDSGSSSQSIMTAVTGGKDLVSATATQYPEDIWIIR